MVHQILDRDRVVNMEHNFDRRSEDYFRLGDNSDLMFNVMFYVHRQSHKGRRYFPDLRFVHLLEFIFQSTILWDA